ncbi:hypothetical protein FOA43_000636 [Brettanomyces nanus]|uniref:Alpha/beta hydrolase fold-3 domain-containing protein n=1 Tax=Eeniella nana TaxID=13502 RepID=A0A875RWN7_EENNA|nr:uncharacterized protein FOA43_000636 [Brettanomyces nanus]QPG73326.1 hypothetical protein FOA43_000636 [Brettanomyces nanus]
MREFRLHDIVLYFILVAIYMVSNYPVQAVIAYFARNIIFFLHLALDIAIKGYIEPLNAKDNVSQKGTLYQHILTRVFRSFIERIHSFSKADPSYSFVADEVWKRWFDIRSFVQCHNGVDLSRYENAPEGIWIRKNFRPEGDPVDLILIYVPNIAVFGSQPYIYLEYLATLHGLLMLQGFDNPAIIITKFPENLSIQDYQQHIEYLTEVWTNIKRNAPPDTQIVLYGDSIGATLILSFLLASASRQDLGKPAAAILVSPIPIWQLYHNTNLSRAANLDFVTGPAIENALRWCLPEKEIKDFGLSSISGVELWKQSLPQKGVVITWGSDEYVSNEIENLGQLLSKCGRVKLWKRRDATHCWPIMSFLTEDSQSEKEDSCFIIAGIISRIALWDTPKYLDPVSLREPMNVLTIDDHHV